jgi:hypothetical protein
MPNKIFEYAGIGENFIPLIIEIRSIFPGFYYLLDVIHNIQSTEDPKADSDGDKRHVG